MQRRIQGRREEEGRCLPGHRSLTLASSSSLLRPTRSMTGRVRRTRDSLSPIERPAESASSGKHSTTPVSLQHCQPLSSTTQHRSAPAEHNTTPVTCDGTQYLQHRSDVGAVSCGGSEARQTSTQCCRLASFAGSNAGCYRAARKKQDDSDRGGGDEMRWTEGGRETAAAAGAVTRRHSAHRRDGPLERPPRYSTVTGPPPTATTDRQRLTDRPPQQTDDGSVMMTDMIGQQT